MDERLLGREAELTAVDAFLARVGVGFTALVLEGEPGIGKTTLWREGVRRARENGLSVLTCRPAEAESKLSFSALTDLLERVPSDSFSHLPEPQRRALEAALLRSAADVPVEPRAVAAAVRGVLAGLAAAAPVLVALDDTQWLDAASARALEFARRRLSDVRVGVFAARRPASSRSRDRLELREAERVELGTLSLAAIHELLKDRLGRSLPRPLLLRVHDGARGNPFYALEIVRELGDAGVDAGEPMPVPKDLRHLVQRRLRRLSVGTRETLLLAAATSDPTVPLLAAALARDPSGALEEAERADVVELIDERVRFAHPLYAAAIYASARSERRQLAHRRLGEVVTDVEQQARHLAFASTTPSPELAALLDEAAGVALRRGAPTTAAELTELALERTPTDETERREERTLDLADRLLLAADADGTRELLRTELDALSTPARRVHALLTLGELSMWASSSSDWDDAAEHPVALAEQAVRAAAGDAAVAARAHSALAGYLESDVPGALTHARRALELIERGADVPSAVHAQALAHLVRSTLFRGEGLDLRRLEQAIELERATPPRLVHDRSTYRLAQWLKYVDEFERSSRGLELARKTASDEGDDLSLVNILINLIILRCWSGAWPEARALGGELTRRIEELGWKSWLAPHVALIPALTGDVDTLAELDAMPPRDGVYDVIRLRPLGLLALSQGDFVSAGIHYRTAVALLEDAGFGEPAIFRIHADAVESVVRAGDLDEGRRLARGLSAHARRSTIPWNRVAAARACALVATAEGRPDAGLAAAEEAVREQQRLPMPFELGRTLLVRGEIERRLKQKRAARQSLEQAVTIFDDLGARLWAERAREELERTGLRRAVGDELTETERRVAELAASGLTNREVAAQLFMSTKTVEANLARAYRKLGIRSRAELGARLGARRAPAQT